MALEMSKEVRDLVVDLLHTHQSSAALAAGIQGAPEDRREEYRALIEQRSGVAIDKALNALGFIEGETA